ncbi:MAG: helix-turn-helix domain-containing protein [Candidatus Moraniibacteriota bacterium]
MLYRIFDKFGLKKEHSDIYLALLDSGISPTGNLAKRLNMPRSTLYGLLENLAQHGLVSQSEKNKVKMWQAVAPETIKTIINEKINTLESTRTDFESVLESLKSSQKTDFISPKFHYFEGIEELKTMLKDVLLYNDLETELCWPVKDVMKVVGEEFLHELNKKRIRSNIYIKVVWPLDKSENIEKNIFLAPGKEVKREVRIAPAGVEFSMGYWAYGNKVMFMSSKAENFGFIVESKELRQLLKNQFNILWNISTPIQNDPKIIKEFLSEVGEVHNKEEIFPS